MDNLLDIHTDIKTKLDKYIENDNIPNIIFYGNHGSGKKHILHYFLNTLYQNVPNKSEYIMNVNCAFGKGIQFIREDLKFFSKTNLFMDNKNPVQCDDNDVTFKTKKPLTIFKSVILLNADKLTTDAQSALRRCIEIFSTTTRFFIVTKDKTNILNPIQSRFHTVYVPHPYIAKMKRCYNLYIYKKHQFHHTTSYINNHKLVIKKYLDEIQLIKEFHEIVGYAKQLYNKGITGLEIIEYIHTSSYFKECIEKYQLLMKLDTYRTKVRNEYMFIYLLLCSIQEYCISISICVKE